MRECYDCEGVGGRSVYCCSDEQCSGWEMCEACHGTGEDPEAPAALSRAKGVEQHDPCRHDPTKHAYQCRECVDEAAARIEAGLKAHLAKGE